MYGLDTLHITVVGGGCFGCFVYKNIFFPGGVCVCVCKLAVEFHPPPVNVIGSTDVPGRWRQSWQNKIFFVKQSMWHHP